jgi:sodium/proline symporter
MSDAAVIAVAFFIYLVAIGVIGGLAYRRTRDLADFVLGGRRLGRWVAALSAGASDMSGWLLLGLPGLAYLSGLEAGWLALGLALGTWANWRFVAKRLRIFSQQADNALTIPEYLNNRFRSRGNAVPAIAALFILFFFLIYTAAGMVAAGKLFETVFGLRYLVAVAIGLAAIVLYTMAGGFLAVSWTDAIQATLMFVALVLVPMVVLIDQGGIHATVAEIRKQNPYLLEPFSDAEGTMMTLIAVLSLVAWGLGYFGQPHILARFKAVHSPGEIGPARRIAVTWVTMTLTAALFVGLVGIPFFEPPLSRSDSEKVFLLLVDAAFPPLLAGFALAAVLAAIMSTADSQLLVSSAAFTQDIYRRLFRPAAGDAELVRVGRLTVLGVALIAFVIAMDRESRVLDLVAYAWAGFGATFGPVLLLSMYWRGLSERGAVAGMIVGGVSVVTWRNMTGGIFEMYEIVPGFVAALLAALLTSRLGPPPREDQVALFDEAVAMDRDLQR